MLVFDASSLIHAWDHYPIKQIPKIWEWIQEDFQQGKFAIPRIALEEVGFKTPECHDLVKSSASNVILPSNEILQKAVEIKQKLGIVGDKYHATGVDENDLIIIASAHIYGGHLVTNEHPQPTPPKVMANRKIPLVCSMPGLGVPCINFLQLLKNSGQMF